MRGVTLDPTWSGLIDDAAIFPPGDVPLDDALAAYDARRGEWYADLVASFVCRDTDLPDVGDAVGDAPLSIVVTGGAGAIAGPLGLAARRGRTVHGLEVALRDLDDLAGNARRVVAAVEAARAEGVLADDVPVHVELPHVASSASWLSAADEVAAAELRLKLRTGGPDEHLVPAPHALARWIDAALDRETPFKCTAGLHRAVRHTVTEGFDSPTDHHGFLNVLLATRRAFDGAPVDEVVALLEERDAGRVLEAAAGEDLAGARRWFTSLGSCSVDEPLADLTALGLVAAPG